MKVLLLDVYPEVPFRISKDTNGGYGTVNNFGSGVVSKLLSRIVAKEVDWPPMDLMYTGAIVRDSGNEVNYSRILDHCDFEDIDLVVMSSSIVAHETEIEAIKHIVSTGTQVCVIGSFVTSKSQPYIDAGAAVVIGEPESFFQKNKAEVLIKAGNKIFREETRVDVNTLPIPAWDLFLEKHSLKFGLFSMSKRMIPMLATRGCPYNCQEYCTYPLQQGRAIRNRDASLIVDEMEYWATHNDCDLFIFRDPVFSLNRSHTVELCKELIERKCKFKFIMETHLKNIDDDLLELLIEAGLMVMKVGIETINPDLLANNKRYSLESDAQRELISHIEGRGVQVVAHYMVGMPGETYSSFDRTIQYANSLNTLIAQFSVFTPYPGTPMYSTYENNITANKFEDFTQYQLVFKHDNLTNIDIDNMLSKAYRSYYVRVSSLIKYVKYQLLGLLR
jgi:radical SAM superfamily enzyme YgiQ (UPF0313 family)